MSHAPSVLPPHRQVRPHRKGAEQAREDIHAKKPDTDVPKLIDLRDKLEEDEEEFIKEGGRIFDLKKVIQVTEEAIANYQTLPRTPDDVSAIARLMGTLNSLKNDLIAAEHELSELQKKLQEVKRDIRNIEESEKNNEILAAELRMSPEAPVSLIEAYEGYTHARALLETEIAKKGRELGMEGVRAMQETIHPFWDQYAAFFEEVKKRVAIPSGGGLGFPLEDYPVFETGAIGPFAEAIARLDLPGWDAKGISKEVENILQAFIKARAELAANPKDLFAHLVKLEEVTAYVARIPSVWEVAYAPKEIKARTQLFAKAEQEIRETSRPSLIEAEQHLRASIRRQPKDLDTLAEALSDVFSDAADPAVRPAKQQEIRDRLEGFVTSTDRATELLRQKEGFTDGRNIIDALVGRVAEVREEEKELRTKKDLINTTRSKVFEYLLKREMSSNPPSERQKLSTEWAASHDREVRETGIQVTTAKRELGKIEAAISLREQILKNSPKLEELEEIEALTSFLERLAHLDSAAAAEEVKAHAGLLSKIQKIEIDGIEYTGTKLLETVLGAGAEQPLRSVSQWLPGDLRDLSIGVAYHNRSGDPNRIVDPIDAIFGAYEFAREHAKKIEGLLSLFESRARQPVKKVDPPKSKEEYSFWSRMRGDEKKDTEDWEKWVAWRKGVDEGIHTLFSEAQAMLLALTRERVRLTRQTTSHAVTDAKSPETIRSSAQLQAMKEKEKSLKDVVGALSPAVRNPAGYDASQLLILARASIEHVVQHLTDRGELTKDALKTVPDPAAFASLSQTLEQTFVPPDMDELKRVFEKRREELVQAINYAQQTLPGRVRDGDEIGGPKIRKDLEDLQKPLDDLKVKRDAQQTALDAATTKLAELQNETLETRLKVFDEETVSEVTKLDPDELLSGDEELRVQQKLEALVIRAEGEALNLKNGLDVSAQSYADWLNGGARDSLTPQPTEFEKMADASLRAEVAKFFSFFEANGAKPTMTRDQFNTWYNGLNVGVGAGMRALIDKLVKAHT